MKLRPKSLAPTHCVRCNAAFGEGVGQVRSTCSPCASALADMHTYSEYTFFKRAYYIPSTEGATLLWLLANGWSREVRLPYVVSGKGPVVQVRGSMVQVPRVDKVLESSA